MAKEEKTKKIVIRRGTIVKGAAQVPGKVMTIDKQDAVHLIASGKALAGTSENIKKVKDEVEAAAKAAVAE